MAIERVGAAAAIRSRQDALWAGPHADSLRAEPALMGNMNLDDTRTAPTSILADRPSTSTSRRSPAVLPMLNPPYQLNQLEGFEVAKHFFSEMSARRPGRGGPTGWLQLVAPTIVQTGQWRGSSARELGVRPPAAA
ncbi:hypothetical protein [Methylorubrum aminovorans]|uniref:hypothetical protein n=1 Tax=Methylorubrum aminovorans TaxID=269069 RepID=UPI003C2BF112